MAFAFVGTPAAGIHADSLGAQRRNQHTGNPPVFVVHCVVNLSGCDLSKNLNGGKQCCPREIGSVVLVWGAGHTPSV